MVVELIIVTTFAFDSSTEYVPRGKPCEAGFSGFSSFGPVHLDLDRHNCLRNRVCQQFYLHVCYKTEAY